LRSTRRHERGEADLVGLYYAEIGRYDLLTKDEEVALAQKIEQGNAARAALRGAGPDLTPAKQRDLRRAVRDGDIAERAFVQSNLRLVVSIANRYHASRVPLLDLIQDGNLGLIHAVQKFDWRKGFKFSTYASWWIRQAISRSLATTGRTIRLPLHVEDRLLLVNRARAELEGRTGRHATRAELAAALDVPEAQIEETIRFALGPLSLSEPLADDSPAELGDLIEDRTQPSPHDAAVAAFLPDVMALLLGALDTRERLIVTLHYGLEGRDTHTLEAISAQLHLSRDRIRQIEAKAMSKLRHPANSDPARDFLDA
jgi:RNA polymerase sigma factor (sigma-70 family)